MLVAITRKVPIVACDMFKQHALTIRGGKNSTPPRRVELKKRVKGAHAILSLLTEKIDKEIIDAAGTQLKIIANYAVGYDNIDCAYAKKKGIFVTNTPGVPTEAVAEHTIALLLSVARRVVESDRFMRTGRYKHWDPQLLIGIELQGKTLGIIGSGKIGSRTAEIAHAGLGMQVVYSDIVQNPALERATGATYLSLDDLLKTSDAISIHAPLLKKTHHLISTAAFKKMKSTAILINTARGPIVDEQALVVALKNNRIFGAGLDVYEHEPKMAAGLAKLSNVVVVPHTGSATSEARNAMARLAAENIVDALSSRVPKNTIA